MALAKDSFFQEPLTEKQEGAVNEVEAMIDRELTQSYCGEEVAVRVWQWEQTENLRCKFEILRRYIAAGWQFRWYSDGKDVDLWAVLK